MVVEKIDRAAQGPVFGAPILLFRSIVRLFSAGFILETFYSETRDAVSFFTNLGMRWIFKVDKKGNKNIFDLSRIHFFENCFERETKRGYCNRDEKRFYN